MGFRPLFDRILVKRVVAPQERPSGIIMAPESMEKPNEGVVVAVGHGAVEGESLRPLIVKIGDRVMIGPYSGIDVKVGSDSFLMLREVDVLGVYEQ